MSAHIILSEADRAKLVPLYAEKQLSIRKIAEDKGLAPSTVRRALIQEGVDLRGRGPGYVKVKDGLILCSCCDKYLEPSAFYACKTSVTGRVHSCKKCYRWQCRRKSYGITKEQYDAQNAQQQGCCAICSVKWEGTASHPDLVVDHDHTTGKIRGLLCPDCNQMLGHAKDSQETLTKALTYLRLHQPSPPVTIRCQVG